MTTSNRVLLLVVMVTLTAQAQFIVTTNNGAITIVQYTGSGGPVTIPSSIDGLPVTSIYDDAFTFSSLTSVTIPGSVTNIGQAAFQVCFSLTNVVILDSAADIGERAFDHCTSLTSVALGSGVTGIGRYAFANCDSLASVTIPASVIRIGTSPFAWCRSLNAIMVSTLNSNYSSVDGVLFDKTQATLIECPGGKAGTYAIPDTVTSVQDEAFAACSSLTRVKIPNSVTNIGSQAFYFCHSLTDATIPDSVTSIGNSAFWYCSNLSSVTLPNSITSIGDAVFEGCGLMRVAIPNGVTSIGDGAFGGCTRLSSVTLPSGIVSIGGSAFSGCTSLAEVTIPSGVTSIGNWAFFYCDNLTGVYFQGNAPSVGHLPVFGSAYNSPTVYYLSGTTGWGATFAACPTALWFLPNPLILTTAPGFGVQTSGFSFMISWATNIPVVVEACSNLANPVWFPVNTNILTNGSAYFSDSQWTNTPVRFYRLRSP